MLQPSATFGSGVALYRLLHRASVLLLEARKFAWQLTPAKAESKKNEDGGWELETDELGHEFPSPVHVSRSLRRQKSGGAECGSKQREACVVASCPPRTACVALWERQMAPSSRWKAAMSTGQPLASACARPSAVEAKSEEQGSQRESLLDSPWAGDFVQSEHHEAVARVDQVTVPGPVGWSERWPHYRSLF